MAARTYEDLRADVLLDVPGCPTHVIDAAIARAARELCVKSGVWREWITLPAVAKQAEYDLTPAWDAEIERVVHVQVDGVIQPKVFWSLYEGFELVFDGGYAPQTSTDVDDYDHEATYAVDDKCRQNGFYWKCSIAISTPETFNDDHWEKDDATGIWARVVLRPTLTATDMPDWIIERCSEGIIGGAKSFIQMQPKRPWTNPQLAQYNKSIFFDAVTRACVQASREWKEDAGVGYKTSTSGFNA